MNYRVLFYCHLLLSPDFTGRFVSPDYKEKSIFPLIKIWIKGSRKYLRDSSLFKKQCWFN